MKRKLIQMAGKTLVVSLPSEWVKTYGLKKGEEIDVDKQGKILIINAGKSYKTEEEIIINIPIQGEFLERMVHLNYILGYDTLKINFEDTQILKKIKKAIKNLLGFEIIQESQNSCIIKSVATETDKEFDNVLRRVFFSLISIGKESYELIKNQKYDELKEEVTNFEETNDKLTFFCERLLNKKSYKEIQKTTIIYCFVWTLEHIADEYRCIAEFLANNKKIKLNKEITRVYLDINNLIEDIHRLFYKNTPKELRNYREKIAMVKENALGVLAKTNTKEKQIIHHLINIQESLSHINVYLL